MAFNPTTLLAFDSDLSTRSRKCFYRLNIKTLNDLVNHTPSDLLACKNFGSVCLCEVETWLSQKELGLKGSTFSGPDYVI